MSWDELMQLDGFGYLDQVPGLVAAALAAGVIGWEREAADRPAGLRTHLLVGISAALLMILGAAIAERYQYEGNTRADPIRLLEAIVAGVSFIGAGTIFAGRRRDGQLVGLTTAASLLVTAGIGACMALGFYALGVVVTGLALVALRVLRTLE